MSEFTAIMQGWKRMCDTYATEDAANYCKGCPMDGMGCGAIFEDGSADPEIIEQKVAAWVLTHPKPV